MSAEAAAVARLASLEDLVRQQGHSVAGVLQRLRELEQFAAADARNREQLQQQLVQLRSEHTSTVDVVATLRQLAQTQSERLAELQSLVQGHQVGLRGVDEKCAVGLRGLEQRLQSEIAACYQRVQAGDAAVTEAVRAVQAQVQGVASGVQVVDDRARTANAALQQRTTSELDGARQRVEQLEAAMRDGLRAVHESLTQNLRESTAQLQTTLQSAVQEQQHGLRALEERTRAELATQQQHSATATNALQQKLDETQQSLHQAVQAASNLLTSEIAGVAQHSRDVDARHRAGHQSLAQELARHDQVMEGIDVNWRASVVNLNAKLDERVATLLQQQRDAADRVTTLVGGVDARVTHTAAAAQQRAEALSQQLHSDCVAPLQEVRGRVGQHETRLQRIHDDVHAARGYVEHLRHETQARETQTRQLTEAAFRALHADLLERVNGVAGAVGSSSVATVHNVVNEALNKMWGDAARTFTSRQGLTTVQGHLALLEQAVRVELCALSDKVGGLTQAVPTPAAKRMVCTPPHTPLATPSHATLTALEQRARESAAAAAHSAARAEAVQSALTQAAHAAKTAAAPAVAPDVVTTRPQSAQTSPLSAEKARPPREDGVDARARCIAAASQAACRRLQRRLDEEMAVVWEHLRALPAPPSDTRWVTRHEVQEMVMEGKHEMTEVVLQTVHQHRGDVLDVLGNIKELVVALTPDVPSRRESGAALHERVTPPSLIDAVPLTHTATASDGGGAVRLSPPPGSSNGGERVAPGIAASVDKSTSTLARDAALLQREVRHALSGPHLPPLLHPDCVEARRSTTDSRTTDSSHGDVRRGRHGTGSAARRARRTSRTHGVPSSRAAVPDDVGDPNACETPPTPRHRTSDSVRDTGCVWSEPSDGRASGAPARGRSARRSAEVRRSAGRSRSHASDHASSPLSVDSPTSQRQRSLTVQAMARGTSAKSRPTSSVKSSYVLHPTDGLYALQVGGSAIRLCPRERPVVLGHFSAYGDEA